MQHAHPDMLTAMQRAGGVKAVRAYPERARACLPGVVLRTTCLVGFPGETRAHFNELERFVRKFEFDHLGVFAFSPEENTPAAKLPGQVPHATAERRRHALMAAQQEIAFRKTKAHLGRKDEALYLKPLGKGVWEARSRGQAPEVDGVTLVRQTGNKVHAGQLAPIRYTGADGYDLRAVPD